MSYDNRIGVTARANRRTDLTTSLAEQGLTVRAWYGVRVFTDTLPSDTPIPDDRELQTLLACENEPPPPTPTAVSPHSPT